VRPQRFALVVVALAIAFAVFLLWRLLREPAALPTQPIPYADNVHSVKSDLCRLARAERSYFAVTARYPPEHELRSNADPSLPSLRQWPYHYEIYVPVPERFVVVATLRGLSGQHPPAFVVDGNLQVCTVMSKFPQHRSTLDSVPEERGMVEYECEPCN
jgi:hypothetical protein